jgi:RNA polymerase sigma-70 factor, ECF subfamily
VCRRLIDPQAGLPRVLSQRQLHDLCRIPALKRLAIAGFAGSFPEAAPQGSAIHRPDRADAPVPDSNRTAHDVTRLLIDLQNGQPEASERLIPLVYSELHDLASHYMRNERPDHTLQPTALVHEAFLKLVDQRQATWQNRSHFYGIAAQAMRRILVDHARRRRATKRDGGAAITLDENAAVMPERSLDLIALDDALIKLAAIEGRYAKVVELRFFGGLEIDQVAEALGISPATVKRDWTFAKAFLQRELDATDLGSAS